MVGSPKKRARRQAIAQGVAPAPIIQPYIAEMPTLEVVRRKPVYDDRICQTFIEDAVIGHSLTATRALVGISRETMNEWERLFPEFATAIARAREIRQRFYEGAAIDMIRRGGDSTRMGMTKFALINVGDDWKDRTETNQNVTFTLASLIGDSMKVIDAVPLDSAEIIDRPSE